MQQKPLHIRRLAVADLSHDPDNARARGPRAVEAIARSLDAFGQQKPIVVTEGGVVIAGNGTLDAAKLLGWEALECQVADLSPAQARAFAVADNRTAELAYWNDAQLLRALDAAQEAEILDATGFDETDIEGIRRALAGEETEGTVPDTSPSGESAAPRKRHPLADEFVVPPYSVLSSQSGVWRDRITAWRERIGSGAEGRGSTPVTQQSGNWALPSYSKALTQAGGDHDAAVQLLRDRGVDVDEILSRAENQGSRFDPVLAETLVSWLCPVGGVVVDPFAGGATRGLIAAMLGRRYYGVEIREEQVASNEEHLGDVSHEALIGQWEQPEWVLGDSTDPEAWKPLGAGSADMAISCPPYFDLEVYSEDEADLSNAPSYEEFAAALAQSCLRTVEALRPNAFAAYVIGPVRDPKTGSYRPFRRDLCMAMEAAGAPLYNAAVYVRSTAFAGIRARNTFRPARKLVPIHEEVLIFCKGDPKAATELIGDVRVAALVEAEGGDD